MNKKYLALTFVVGGTVAYFYPQLSHLTNDSGQIMGIIFAIGGVILWYLPSSNSKEKKK